MKLRGVDVVRAMFFKIVRPQTGCTGEKSYEVRGEGMFHRKGWQRKASVRQRMG